MEGCIPRNHSREPSLHPPTHPPTHTEAFHQLTYPLGLSPDTDTMPPETSACVRSGDPHCRGRP